MREVLEPVFGESGAVVAQFFVILIFILILTGVCYWLFRRFYSTGLVSGGRSRVPRLGVIDTLSIDHRHRLVLVRRDNVEHLILIGKSSDLVVESSIVRSVPANARARPPGQPPRQQSQQLQQAQPQQAQQPQQPQPQQSQSLQRPQPQQRRATPPPQPALPPAAPSRAAPPSAAPRGQTTGISEPIPFPQNRRPQTRAAPQAATVAASEPVSNDRATGETAEDRQKNAREASAVVAPLPLAAAGGVSVTAASGHFEEPAHPTRVEPAFSLADALDEIADEPIAARVDASTDRAAPIPVAAEAAPSTAIDSSATEVAEIEAAAAMPVNDDDQAEQTVEALTEADEGDTAATVSNLEQEMARLLGEITAKRDA